MNTANNQLHQETERRLRQELLGFLAREQEPTVSELCEAARINRSTFYRHYRDIPDLMEKTEKEIQKGLFRTVGRQGDFLARLESSSDALELLHRPEPVLLPGLPEKERRRRAGRRLPALLGKEDPAPLPRPSGGE